MQFAVELLHYTPLSVVVKAARTCYDSMALSDSFTEEGTWYLGEHDAELLRRILSHGHGSVIEHAVYTFNIKGISRACLQELVRHRISSFSVQSTRYCLGRIKHEAPFNDSLESWHRASEYLVWTDDAYINNASMEALDQVRRYAACGIPNDKLKMCLPESFKTEVIMTINARSLNNYFSLRLDKRAHWEIKMLAETMLQRVPNGHELLFNNVYHANSLQQNVTP